MRSLDGKRDRTNMNGDLKGIKERIQKLLTLGNNVVDTPEGKVAFQKAAELMEKYQLEMIDIEALKTSHDGLERSNVQTFYNHAPYWEAQLAMNVASTFDCRSIRVLRGHKRDTKFAFMGHKVDIEMVNYVFRFLRSYIDALADTKFSKQKDRDEYSLAFVASVSERLYGLKTARTNIQTSESTALVLVKKNAVKEFVDDEFPKLSKGRRTRPNLKNQDAVNQGLEDGKKVPLSKAVNGNDNVKGHIN